MVVGRWTQCLLLCCDFVEKRILHGCSGCYYLKNAVVDDQNVWIVHVPVGYDVSDLDSDCCYLDRIHCRYCCIHYYDYNIDSMTMMGRR